MKCRRLLPVISVLLLSCALLAGCSRNPYADLIMECYRQERDDVVKYISFTDMFLDTFGYAQEGNAIECVKSFRPQGSFKSPSINSPTTGIALEFIRRIEGRDYYGVYGCTLESGERAYCYLPFFESRNIYAYSLSEASPTLVSVKGLCYADFNGISLGSTAAEVMAIDPAVYIDDRPSMSEDYKNLSWMSLHLLDEGILYICYSRESEDQPYRVSGLRLYRDCALQELYSACSIRALDNFYVSPEDRPPRRDPVPAEPANKPDVLGDVPERENAIIVSNAYIHFLVERMENPELQPDIVWDWVQENPRYAPELPLFEWESWGSGVFSDSYNHQYDFRPVENDASRSLYYQMDSLHFLFPLVKAKAYRFIVLEGDEMHEVGPRIYASKIWRREDFKDIGRGDTLAALAKIDWTAEAYLDRKARPLTLRTFHLCEDGILAFDLARDDPDDQFRITKKTFCPGGDLSVLGIQLPAKAVIQEPDLPKEDAK
ncbi:MAG: hypothetical protein IKL89_05695 [Clostridia bacterium]|nr:hypothetical protein [Clostridia bacterium]